MSTTNNAPRPEPRPSVPPGPVLDQPVVPHPAAARPAGPPVARPQDPALSGREYRYDVARPVTARLPEPSRAARRGQSWFSSPLLRWGMNIFGIVLIVIGVAVLIWTVFRPMGFGTSLVAFTAALVPVAIVLLAVWWIDRYTPQTKGSLIFAFSWGAIASVGLTLLFAGTFMRWALPEGKPHVLTVEFIGAAIQAPVLEEAFKSLGLLLLVLMGLFPRMRRISGPIDGVVYAALIAGGFAFTENILYFARSFHEAQAAGDIKGFWTTFFLRGILSPFAHASFTGLAGLGLGIAAERRSFMLHWGLGLSGLAGGMVLHGLWNGSTFFLPVNPDDPMESFVRFYLTVQVPIFLILAAIVIFLRLRERRIVRRQLSDYGRAGWFSPEEVEMLVRMGRRRRAEKWAGKHGALARMAMRDLITSAVELAMQRHRATHARRTARDRRAERDLLERITADRRLIGALTAPVTRA